MQNDPAFIQIWLDEVIAFFITGETDTARLIIHDLVNVIVGVQRSLTRFTSLLKACIVCFQPMEFSEESYFGNLRRHRGALKVEIRLTVPIT